MTTKSTFSVCNQNFTVSAKMVAEGIKFPFSSTSDWTKHNKFKITIRTNGLSCSFFFFDSHDSYTRLIKQLDHSSLASAFYSFLLDAQSGELSFDVFCSDLAYEYNHHAGKVYQACVKSFKKLERITSISACDLINDLQETENI